MFSGICYNMDGSKTNKKSLNKKSITCDDCKKSFKTKSHLNVHKRRIHSGEKMNKSEVCDNSFTQKSSLTRHMLVHNGIKEYQCHVCDKRFARKSDLKKHMLVHSGKKDFQICASLWKIFCSKI